MSSKKAHLVLCHPSVYNSKGELGKALAGQTQSFLETKGFVCTTTDISEGKFSIEQEAKHFFDSDIISYHFPMFWFDMPSQLKDYIDQVYIGGKFFGHSEGSGYGNAGKLVGKEYIVVTTCNANEESFAKGNFFDGKSIDDVYCGFHLAQKYIGLSHKATIAHYNVIQGDNSDIEKKHLAQLSAVNL